MIVQEAKRLPGGDWNALPENDFIEDCLSELGYSPEKLEALPATVFKRVLDDASRSAALELEEIEARARFVEEIHRASLGE